MKRSQLIAITILFLVSALALSACGGSDLMPSGWSGVANDADTVYLSANQFVYAIDINDGSQKWKYPPDKPQGNKTFFAAPVLTDDGQLLVGSYDYSLYSLDPASGTQKWSFPTHNRIVGSPLVTKDWIYLPSTDNRLYQIDHKGKPGWEFVAGGPLWSTPVASEKCNCVYLTSMDHKVYAVDVGTGESIWDEDLGTSILYSPVLSADGQLYVTTLGGDVVALDALTGNVIWRKTYSEIWAGPGLDDDSVYVGELAGVVHALKGGNGTEKWSYTTTETSNGKAVTGRITGTPAVSLSGVYVTTETGYLYSLDLNGQLLFSHNLLEYDSTQTDKTKKGYTIYSPPHLVSSAVGQVTMILVAPRLADYLLIALNSDGTEMWRFIPPK